MSLSQAWTMIYFIEFDVKHNRLICLHLSQLNKCTVFVPRSTNTMEIQLFNTAGKHDISLTQYLVQHDFATAIPDHMTDRSISLSSHRYRRISEADEPDSVSCHEREIPG